MNVALLVGIPSIAALLMWISYLLFCRFLVNTTKDAKSLEYAAKAARAYRDTWQAQFARAIGRLAARKRRRDLRSP